MRFIYGYAILDLNWTAADLPPDCTDKMFVGSLNDIGASLTDVVARNAIQGRKW